MADGSVIIEIKGDSTDVDQKIAKVKKSFEEMGASDAPQKVTADTQRLSDELKNTAGAADSAKNAVEGMGSAGGQAINALASAFAAAGVSAALHEIEAALKACVDASVSFESAMASFNKVAKLSNSDLGNMAEQVKQLSTQMPATAEEIAGVAEAAKRLGVSQESLMSFTETMVNLGNVSDLTADQAATALARFANIVGTSANDYERLGSVIVALGNNFATSESEIMAMSSRLASAGKLAGLTESEIMGLSAAMSSVGIQAEAGGTAMTQTLTALEKAVTNGGDKLEQFADIAGMSAGQFAKAWKESSITAIQAFISGLGRLDEAGESATLILDDLGLSGVRQAGMLKNLALASDTLTATIETANQAWAENTELAETAAARYDTTEVKVKLAANAVNNLKIAVGDQLTPALGALTTAGTSAFSWAADFVSNNPLLVSALTGVVAAIGVVAAGFAVYAAKAALATIATTAWGAALMATPIGPIALAIGGLVAAFTAITGAIDEANSRAKTFSETMQDTLDAVEAQREATAQQRETVELLTTQLETLAAKENKTTAEKEQLLAITNQLNEAVPGLGLSYDKLTDSLSMTTEQVIALARAQADAQERSDLANAIVTAEREQAAATRELEQAKIDLADAQERYEQALKDGTGFDLVRVDVLAAEKAVSDLEAAMASNAEVTAELKARLEELGEAVEDSGDAVEDTSENYEALSEAAKIADETTISLTKSTDNLTSALKEQTEEGSLSLETTNKLIDAGYAAALAIDEETGAVTLNEAAYVDVASAKIQAQIATLEAQKASLTAAGALASEEAAARADSSAYWDLARSKVAAANAEDVKAIEVQIAALNRAQDALGSYASAATSAARGSGGASKKIKTQAEKDLEEFKTLKAEMDHQRKMDAISEEEYYRKLVEYRDRYLADESNISTYRSITEKIYAYDQSLAQDEQKLWAQQTETWAEELQDRLEEVQSQQEKVKNTLSNYGDLFTIEDAVMSLESLQGQIDAINAYGDAIQQLKERGISEGLLDQVLGMNTDKATQYANKLLAMSEDQYDNYLALWDEKQAAAARVSSEIYKDELEALQTEFLNKIPEAAAELPDELKPIGQDAVRALTDGIEETKAGAVAAAADVTDSVLAEFKRLDGISDMLRAAVAESSAQLSSQLSVTVNAAAEAQAARSRTNAYQSAAAAAEINRDSDKGDAVINIDGKEFYRATLSSLRAVEDETPRVLDDK